MNKQKSTKGCPSECFNSGENPKLICQWFAKSLVSKKIYCLEQLYGSKYDVNEAIELLFDDEFSLPDGEIIVEEESEDAFAIE